MLDLDTIKSGEQLTEEQLKDLWGKKEEAAATSLPEGFDPEKMNFALDERSGLPEGFNPELGTFDIPNKIQSLRGKISQKKEDKAEKTAKSEKAADMSKNDKSSAKGKDSIKMDICAKLSAEKRRQPYGD